MALFFSIRYLTVIRLLQLLVFNGRHCRNGIINIQASLTYIILKISRINPGLFFGNDEIINIKNIN